MDRQNPHSEQVELLVRVLPIVAAAECFALKGGTAINLFYRDTPRLSVDIDLVYTPIKTRDESLSEISTAMADIGNAITRRLGSVKVQYSRMGRTDVIIKLLVQSERAVVKIELSPVLRGTVYPSAVRRMRPAAEERFGFVDGFRLGKATRRAFDQSTYSVESCSDQNRRSSSSFLNFGICFIPDTPFSLVDSCHAPISRECAARAP